MRRSYWRAVVGQRRARFLAGIVGLTVLLLTGCGSPSTPYCLSTRPVPGSGGESEAYQCGTQVGMWLRQWWVVAIIVALVLLTALVAALVLLWRRAARRRRAA
jgi:hypothetical protein